MSSPVCPKRPCVDERASFDEHRPWPVAAVGRVPLRCKRPEHEPEDDAPRERHAVVPLSATFLVVIALTAPVNAQSGGVSPTHEHGSVGGQVLMIARDLEVRLAVNALPKDLRDLATVLALERDGYVTARRGTNPFTCIVSRRGGTFYPVCFDEEGARTILPAFADDAVMRLKGASGLYRPKCY